MNYCASTFEDELFSATDLNRRAGYVLDQALLHPVTITRNEQAFALLPRENMSRLVETARHTQTLLELANLAFRLIQGDDIGLEHPNAWLKSFDTEEINELIVELFDAYRQAQNSEDWNILAATIHEWKESAIAIRSQELAEAFDDQTEEKANSYEQAN
ncbi:MAG: hypothetical protein HC930_00650 [Hydrococcus sp. SU_1_0]|nr:hypothetical protein [Hydrococcus sp. SU_1_0]